MCVTRILSDGKFAGFEMCQEWFTMKDIGSLDSAYCNKDQRIVFLTLYSSTGKTLTTKMDVVVNSTSIAGCLEWFNLRGVDARNLTTSDELPYFKQKSFQFNDRLVSLKMSNIKISVTDFQHAFKLCVNLEILILSSCGKKSISLKHICSMFKQLRSVQVGADTQLSSPNCDEELKVLSLNHLTKLMSLNLGDSYQMSDLSMYILSHMTNITELSLTQSKYKHKFGRSGLRDVLIGCTKLNTLEIHDHEECCLEVNNGFEPLIYNETAIESLQLVGVRTSIHFILPLLQHNATLTSLSCKVCTGSPKLECSVLGNDDFIGGGVGNPTINNTSRIHTIIFEDNYNSKYWHLVKRTLPLKNLTYININKSTKWWRKQNDPTKCIDGIKTVIELFGVGLRKLSLRHYPELDMTVVDHLILHCDKLPLILYIDLFDKNNVPKNVQFRERIQVQLLSCEVQGGREDDVIE